MNERSGREPFLSGAQIGSVASGNEPSLGGEHGIRQVREHLLSTLAKPSTTHLRRAAIGDWLAATGDPRPGVGLGEDGLPDLVWCPVSGSEVLLRDTAGPVQVERFYLAKYPVTWVQYRLFLEAKDGHANLIWWDGLRRRLEYERTDLSVDNQPAQEVSWFDAVAYCRWLSSKLDYDVRIPTEWEWQLAATGGDGELLYPWGHDTGAIYANTRESHLHRATAVGMYPAGESPVGALDMAGTILEWCINEFANPDHVKLTGNAPRVLRGGSWFLIFNFARNIFRTGYDPYFRFNSVGFRLAASSLAPRPRPVIPDPQFDAEPEPNPESHSDGPSPDVIAPTNEDNGALEN